MVQKAPWGREKTSTSEDEKSRQKTFEQYLAEMEFDRWASSQEIKKGTFVFLDDHQDSTVFEKKETSDKERRLTPPIAFVFDKRREGPGLFSWDLQNLGSIKVLSAKRILRHLDQQYEKLFKDQIPGLEEDFVEKQLFFNSNLLYLISATDGNEDTLGHSQLVASYSLVLTKALGIEDKSFQVNIERGALLHDFGKICIPESIMRKAGPLTKREREIVKEHPILGYELIKEFDFLKRAALVVLFHHENYDGSGYPYGLVGEEIPLEARIFALADALDAMTSDRPYSEGISFEEAYRKIEKAQGSQFDPLLVEVFLSIPLEEWRGIKARAQVSPPFPTIH